MIARETWLRRLTNAATVHTEGTTRDRYSEKAVFCTSTSGAEWL
jgi:hypothetical protein